MKIKLLAFSVMLLSITLFTSVKAIAYPSSVKFGPCTWSVDFVRSVYCDGKFVRYDVGLTCVSGPCTSGIIRWSLLEIPVSTDPNDINNYTFSGDFTAYVDFEAEVFNDIMVTGTASKGISQSSINNDNPAGKWSLYPNPAGSTINLSTNQNAEGDNYQVTNLTGQIVGSSVISGPYNSINISSLPVGMYLLNVYSGNNKIQTIKFSKQ